MRIALVMILTLLLAGCGVVGDDLAGPCLHVYQEPIITLASDDATYVQISDITIDGRTPPDPTRVIGGPAVGVSEVAGVPGFRCDLPCGFGTDSGEWVFVVTSADHADLEVQREVDYAEFEGGCPSANDGGAVIDLDLT
jgi:hypothetical protein